MYKAIELELENNNVLKITLNRPEKRNAFNDEVIRELTQIFSKEALDDKIRIIVLKGAGSAFCAGGDLQWISKSIELSYAENLKDTRALSQMFATINDCPKPLIGLIHGAAIGGGVGLVSVCDIAIATERTLFSLSEARLGIVAACIGPFVISKIGASNARRFFISSERFYAPKAQEIGLIHEVVADEKELLLLCKKIIEGILQCGPNAINIAKKFVLDMSWPEKRAQFPNCLHYTAEMLANIRVSEEGQEGVRAFLEKRKPKWL
ncbi:MAG: enoyl-CoA hydratase/isomerase family protein [Deltaproteobacteria bacterium]|nr:enoyl-CoA hydratase/isomerase family protein [Deltaproteobacteria bacterium]